MIFDWTNGPLAEGLGCYRRQEFFLAHEHWESIWLACQEPDKTFLQALIQVAAGFHHLQRHNLAGASSLLTTARRRLDPFPADYGGIAIDALRRNITTSLEAITCGCAPSLIPCPRICQNGEATNSVPVE